MTALNVQYILDELPEKLDDERYETEVSDTMLTVETAVPDATFEVFLLGGRVEMWGGGTRMESASVTGSYEAVLMIAEWVEKHR